MRAKLYHVSATLFGYPATSPRQFVVSIDGLAPGPEWKAVRSLAGLSFAGGAPGQRPLSLWQRTHPNRTSCLTEGLRPYEHGNWQCQAVVYGPSVEVCPEIADAERRLAALDLGPVHMTGSGSACFVFLGKAAPAEIDLEALQRGAKPGAWAAVLTAGASNP